MRRNIHRSEGSSPDDSERMTEYWGNTPDEVDLPWDVRGTGRHKSKSKGKEKGNRRGSIPDSQRDEFSDDSDLE